MSSELKKRMTPAEYLVFERQSEIKHEFYRGEIFAMSGASLSHNRISRNISGDLNKQFIDRPCEVFSSDMRVKVTANGLYTYPDIVAICQPPAMEDKTLDTMLNPQMIIEVLSKSTELYDRTKKFDLYSQLESFTDYVLVAQDRVSVDYLTRQPNDQWQIQRFRDIADVVTIESLGCELKLADVYRKVVFKEEETDATG